MDFRLYYRGPLASNGHPEDKQAIRRALHPQIRRLVEQSGHSAFTPYLTMRAPGSRPWTPPEHHIDLRVPRDTFVFVPLGSSRHHMVARLHVLFLRPSPPGSLVHHGGDIDNRVKTLFDALHVPPVGQLPPGDAPQEDEWPFYCVLEDDAQITDVQVTTDRLLDSTDHGEVVLILHVRLSPTRLTGANIGL